MIVVAMVMASIGCGGGIKNVMVLACGGCLPGAVCIMHKIIFVRWLHDSYITVCIAIPKMSG
jgi:hypothetical protein